MGKLQEYYRLFDMFKGKLTNEQKNVLESLEDQLISDEILPAISKSVAPVLSTLRRQLSLVVEYDPEGGITVKTTRDTVVVKEKTVKEYQIPATNKVVKTAEAGTIKRAPATGLCVWITEDDFIQEKTAALTMAKAINTAGAGRVASLNIYQDKEPLISKNRHPRYSSGQYSLNEGYLLNTHSNTKSKKKILEKISDALHLNWKIEIVE